jgi:hypothetical protein
VSHEIFRTIYRWVDPDMLSGYVLRFEGSARAGELLALRIRAFVIACCIPREWLPREFLQMPEFVALQPEVPSRLKDGFRCSYRSAWLGIYFVKNKLRAPLGRNPLGDPYCLGQPSLVPFITCDGTVRLVGLLR